MGKVAYVVNDVLGQMCDTLGIEGYTLVGGHYTFGSTSDYQAVYDLVYNTIIAWYDDDNPDNDATADDYLDRLEKTNYTVMYWSTEKQEWY